MDASYDDDFYASVAETARVSASVITPIVVGLLHPASVIDVGCGSGAWLRAFVDAGCTGVGIDGATVADEALLIPQSTFRRADLSDQDELQSLPERCGRFDLVVCLEVAEHLSANVAETLIECLSQLSDAVLFSAAVPGQGGLHHVNEQPPAYWAEKFARRGFVVCDLVRPIVWDNELVSCWYAQNTLLYLRAEHPAITSGVLTTAEPRWLIHPTAYLRARSRPLSLAEIVRGFPSAARRSVLYRWRRATRRST